jgi:rare lipoprotein A
MGSGTGRFFSAQKQPLAMARAKTVCAKTVRAAAAGLAAATGLVAAGVLAGCSAVDTLGSIVDPRYGISQSARVVAPGDPVPKGGGAYRIGAAYTIGGHTYQPAEDKSYRAEGLASWYGEDFHGRSTANGEVFDMNSVSAAHTTLPMPSYVRVTNLGNNRSVIVRVNDRGPYHADRIIDVSVKTAVLLGFYTNGVARVRVEYVGSAPLEGSDDNMLIATLRNGGEPAPPPSLVRVASAKSFVPRNVPVPPERPWGLGQTDGSAATYVPASSGTPAGDPSRPALVPAASTRSLN